MTRRLCIVMQWHPAYRVGGAELAAELLAAGLQARGGWDVHYAAEFPAGYTLLRAASSGVTVHPLVQRPHDLSMLNYQQLRRLGDALRPDLYYQRGANTYTGMVAQIASGQGRPLVWASANTVDCGPGQFRSPFRVERGHLVSAPRALARQCLGRARDHAYSTGIAKAAAVVCQTAEQAQLLRAWKGRESAVIPNGHPVPTQPPHPRSDPPVVLWVANLKPSKRPLLFVRLARALQDVPAAFVMIGYPHDQRLARRVGDEADGLRNFRYLGGLPMAETLTWFERAHLLVCTSAFEGFPNVFIQGWLRGVPTVSLGIDPDGLLTTQRMGSCVSTEDELVAATRHALTHRDAWLATSGRARQYAMTHHGVEVFLDKHERLFSELIGRWGRRPP